MEVVEEEKKTKRKRRKRRRMGYLSYDTPKASDSGQR